jgi:hypothetical protein
VADGPLPTDILRLRRAASVQSRALPDGAVLVDMQTGQCFELNQTGAEVWALLRAPTTVASLCDHLEARYRRGAEQITRDVGAVVEQLLGAKLVERVPFSESVAHVRFEDGGVAVDLASGTYLALNRTAAIVCDALAAAPAEDAVARVARELAISRDEAGRAVGAVGSGLASPAPPALDPGPFRYERAGDGDGYTLTHAGAVRLRVSSDGRRVTVPSPTVPTSQVYEYLRATAPKILFLRGATVLHGGACRVGDGLRALCGASGAGKTTTVRAFGAAGRAVVSEDLLPLASLAPPRLYVEGERRIHAWAREAAGQVAAGRETTLDTAALEAALSGETARVDELWFLDVRRRHAAGAEIRLRRLPEPEAAVALMGATFLGAASADGWRRFLADVRAIVTSTRAFEAALPDGLDRLAEAARAYAENSAS